MSQASWEPPMIDLTELQKQQLAKYKSFPPPRTAFQRVFISASLM